LKKETVKALRELREWRRTKINRNSFEEVKGEGKNKEGKG
jgi:hypothetical protein